MADWKERMYCGIGEYLRSTGLDCVQVLRMDEDACIYDLGGCVTCGSDTTKNSM